MNDSLGVAEKVGFGVFTDGFLFVITEGAVSGGFVNVVDGLKVGLDVMTVLVGFMVGARDVG